jgi:hypothetical protein
MSKSMVLYIAAEELALRHDDDRGRLHPEEQPGPRLKLC